MIMMIKEKRYCNNCGSEVEPVLVRKIPRKELPYAIPQNFEAWYAECPAGHPLSVTNYGLSIILISREVHVPHPRERYIREDAMKLFQ